MQVGPIGKKIIKKQDPAINQPVNKDEMEEEIEEDEKTIYEDKKEIDLSKKNGVLTYNMEDIELKKIFLEKNVCVRILTNNAGKFVDIRKYYKGFPTKRGVRISIEMFKELLKVIKNDILK